MIPNLRVDPRLKLHLADRHPVAREHQHGDGGPAAAPAPSIRILDISIVHLLSTITDIVGFVIIIITVPNRLSGVNLNIVSITIVRNSLSGLESVHNSDDSLHLDLVRALQQVNEGLHI